MKHGARSVLCIAVLLAAQLSACGKKQDDKPAGTAGSAGSGAVAGSGGTAGATPVKTPDRPALTPPKLDAKLQALLDRAVTECKISGPGSNPRDCGPLDDELHAYIKGAGIATLDTLTNALMTDEAPRIATAGWYILAELSTSAMYQVEQAPDTVSNDSVERLMRAVEKNNTVAKGAHSYVATAVLLATLKGMVPRAQAMLDGITDEQVKGNGAHAMMRHARMAGFPWVQKAAESTALQVKVGALEAPVAMPKWTDEEKAALCPWYLTFLPSEDRAYTETVAKALLRCGGEYVDKVLDEADRRVAAKTYDRPFAFAIREICSSTLFTAKGGSNDTQCVRTRKFLEGAADNAALTDDVRAFAVSSIAYAWRDKPTRDLMEKKYAKSKVAPIAKAATDAIEMLKSFVK